MTQPVHQRVEAASQNPETLFRVPAYPNAHILLFRMPLHSPKFSHEVVIEEKREEDFPKKIQEKRNPPSLPPFDLALEIHNPLPSLPSPSRALTPLHQNPAVPALEDSFPYTTARMYPICYRLGSDVCVRNRSPQEP